ncbi:MAG: helix-hairpin-helix domain-containing protein, partial [Ignavibacteriaceae bacterium]|nr:helix-hairpin-helix domain-containing protein [Ignavibacteriaceae bacterium]
DLKPTSVSERTIKTDSQIKSVLKTKSINLNSATMDQLTMIPGIGPKTALNILEYRKEVGRFSSINQLLEVKGIANSKFEKIKNFVYVQR